VSAEVVDSHGASDALHARVGAMIRAFERRAAMPESFDALAVDLARFQAERVPGYARLCSARGVDLRKLTRAAQAPAVPADAFKLASVFAFDVAEATAIFRTSGTTIGARGVHAMRHTSSYDAAALAFGREMLARNLERVPVLLIGPSDVEAPDSSLAHMCSLFARAFGAEEARGAAADRAAFVLAGELDVAGLRRRIAGLSAKTPALVLATSFALVHLFDALTSTSTGVGSLPLPPGSRVMLTGGFKGRTREVSADELRRQIARVFGVEERAVVGEYGMTELSSQFWEATLVDPGARHGAYVAPPWARVVPVDPVSLDPVADGAIGIARIEDLANVDSAFAVLANDRVRRAPGGFELLGRAPGASPRGCSIALDEMLSMAGRGERGGP
jgi:hypothetical protein